jgi:serine/threonine protein kinase
MAEVFLAKAAGPMGFEKTLVLKRILPHLAEESGFVEMFLSEAQLAAQLNHPNIVQIFDFGEANGQYFLAMEYIDGPNLRVLIKRASTLGVSLPPALCARIIANACEGLAFSHDFANPETGELLGLIHRDVSPDNIILSRQGAVKVVDFGIAKAAGQSHRTQTGVIKGKLAYMPPEQVRAEPLDRRVDVYALGVVLYELLTGNKPFDASTEASLMRAILFEPLVLAVERRPDLPEAMQQILELALAKDRERRYPDCTTFQADLEQFILSQGKLVATQHVAQLIAQLSGEGGAPMPTPQPGSPPRGFHPMARPRPGSGPHRAPEAVSGTPPPSNSLAPPATPDSVDPQSEMRTLELVVPEKQSTAVQPQVAPVLAEPTISPPLAPTSRLTSKGKMLSLIGAGAALLVMAVGLLSGRSNTHPPPKEPAVAVATPPLAEAPIPSTAPPPTPAPIGADAQEEHRVPASEEPAAAVVTPPPAGEPGPSIAEPPPTSAPKGADTSRAGRVTDEGASGPSAPPSPLPKAGAVQPPPMKENGVATVIPGNSPKPSPKPIKPKTSEQKPQGRSSISSKPAVVEMGTIDIRTRPYATIFLDGASLGETPLKPFLHPAGRYTVRIVSAELGKEVERSIEVKAGEITRVAVILHNE